MSYILKFKKIPMQLSGDPKAPAEIFDYQAQLLSILRFAPPGDFLDFAQVEAGLKVLALVREAKGPTLRVDDSVYDTIKERVLKAKWGLVDPVVLDFVHDMTHAEHKPETEANSRKK